MSDETPQDLYVQVGAAFFSFSGMSKDTVLSLFPGFGAGAGFVDKPTYDAGIAAITQQSPLLGTAVTQP